MISHTITEAIYNLMYFASVDGRVLMGFINFNYQNMERYQSIAQEMLASFHFTDEKEQNCEPPSNHLGGETL